jgi:glycosyltransferase involved in cell wall biosynthesis
MISKVYLPSVSLVVFSYNQESYIEEAVTSALAQDYPYLKIIISDDFSKDKTFEIAKNIVNGYSGKHNVKCRKNESNLGLIKHVNKIISEVDSELVVVAAGDDISLENRVTKLVSAYMSSGKPKLLFSKAFQIDEAGKLLEGYSPGEVIPLEDLDSVINSLNFIDGRVGLYLGATGAWSMELWKKYGPIQHDNCWEDVVMGFRAALENSYKFVDEPLVKYRVNIGLSSQSAHSFKGKIAFRNSKIKLKRDLARQRYDDLVLDAKITDSEVIKKVLHQALAYSISSAYYESVSKIWWYFKKNPGLTIVKGFKECKFLLRVSLHECLQFAKN